MLLLLRAILDALISSSSRRCSVSSSASTSFCSSFIRLVHSANPVSGLGNSNVRLRDDVSIRRIARCEWELQSCCEDLSSASWSRVGDRVKWKGAILTDASRAPQLYEKAGVSDELST